MPASQRNPFDFSPQEPDFFSPFPPVRQREFPPLFPVRNPEPPPQAAPSSGSFGDLIGMFLSPGSRGGTGGMNLVGMLSNVQKAIQTAQTVLPMIQQFGPLIRNAPAILSALKSVPDTESKADSGDSEKTETEAEVPVPETKAAEDEKIGEPKEKSKNNEEPEKTETKTVRPAPAKNVHPKKNSLKNTDKLVTRPSRPRLYI